MRKKFSIALTLICIVVFSGIMPRTAYGLTSGQPVLVKDIYPGTSSAQFHFLTNVNGTLFFVAYTNNGAGDELWKSDGTAAGTKMVKDVWPGSDDGMETCNTCQFAVVNNTLYFVGNDGVNGVELWKSDGTAAGTVMVKNIRTGIGDSSPTHLTNVNGTLFFAASDGAHGYELWKSDGTEAGTVMVKDINLSGSSVYSDITKFVNINGVLFFIGNEPQLWGDEYGIWKSDGTEAGTISLHHFDYPPFHLTDVNGALFFGGDSHALWKSDGTPAGTTQVAQGMMLSYSSKPAEMNGLFFFDGDGDVNQGLELWKSDSTQAGTVIVKDIFPGWQYSYIDYLTAVNGTLFFQANDGALGPELWKSDGTEAGTVMVTEINPTYSSVGPEDLTNVNGYLFFRADDGVNGKELWRSDGTASGTFMVKDIYPGDEYDSSAPRDLTNVNGTLFFTAIDYAHGQELWKLDVPVAPALLAIDPDRGQPGSYFAITGEKFPVNTAASVLVNGQSVGTVDTDAVGNVSFQIHTDVSAPVGMYVVTVQAGSAQAAVVFTLDASAALNPQGSGSILEVPVTVVPLIQQAYLPLVSQ